MPLIAGKEAGRGATIVEKSTTNSQNGGDRSHQKSVSIDHDDDDENNNDSSNSETEGHDLDFDFGAWCPVCDRAIDPKTATPSASTSLGKKDNHQTPTSRPSPPPLLRRSSSSTGHLPKKVQQSRHPQPPPPPSSPSAVLGHAQGPSRNQPNEEPPITGKHRKEKSYSNLEHYYASSSSHHPHHRKGTRRKPSGSSTKLNQLGGGSGGLGNGGGGAAGGIGAGGGYSKKNYSNQDLKNLVAGALGMTGMGAGGTSGNGGVEGRHYLKCIVAKTAHIDVIGGSGGTNGTPAPRKSPKTGSSSKRDGEPEEDLQPSVLNPPSSLYCSEECRRIDEMRSRLAFAHLGPAAGAATSSNSATAHNGTMLHSTGERVDSPTQSHSSSNDAYQQSHPHHQLHHQPSYTSSTSSSARRSNTFTHSQQQPPYPPPSSSSSYPHSSSFSQSSHSTTSPPVLDFSTRRLSRGSQEAGAYSYRPSLMQRVASSDDGGSGALSWGRASRGSTDSLVSQAESDGGYPYGNTGYGTSGGYGDRERGHAVRPPPSALSALRFMTPIAALPSPTSPTRPSTSQGVISRRVAATPGANPSHPAMSRNHSDAPPLRPSQIRTGSARIDRIHSPPLPSPRVVDGTHVSRSYGDEGGHDFMPPPPDRVRRRTVDTNGGLGKNDDGRSDRAVKRAGQESMTLPTPSSKPRSKADDLSSSTQRDSPLRKASASSASLALMGSSFKSRSYLSLAGLNRGNGGDGDGGRSLDTGAGLWRGPIRSESTASLSGLVAMGKIIPPSDISSTSVPSKSLSTTGGAGAYDLQHHGHRHGHRQPRSATSVPRLSTSPSSPSSTSSFAHSHSSARSRSSHRSGGGESGAGGGNASLHHDYGLYYPHRRQVSSSSLSSQHHYLSSSAGSSHQQVLPPTLTSSIGSGGERRRSPSSSGIGGQHRRVKGLEMTPSTSSLVGYAGSSQGDSSSQPSTNNYHNNSNSHNNNNTTECVVIGGGGWDRDRDYAPQERHTYGRSSSMSRGGVVGGGRRSTSRSSTGRRWPRDGDESGGGSGGGSVADGPSHGHVGSLLGDDTSTFSERTPTQSLSKAASGTDVSTNHSGIPQDDSLLRSRLGQLSEAALGDDLSDSTGIGALGGSGTIKRRSKESRAMSTPGTVRRPHFALDENDDAVTTSAPVESLPPPPPGSSSLLRTNSPSSARHAPIPHHRIPANAAGAAINPSLSHLHEDGPMTTVTPSASSTAHNTVNPPPPPPAPIQRKSRNWSWDNLAVPTYRALDIDQVRREKQLKQTAALDPSKIRGTEGSANTWKNGFDVQVTGSRNTVGEGAEGGAGVGAGAGATESADFLAQMAPPLVPKERKRLFYFSDAGD